MNRPSDRRAPASETWLEIVAAVDYLSRGHRPGFTVWDAVEEELRCYTAYLVAGDDAELAVIASAELPWADPDPLRSALERFVEHSPGTADGDDSTTDLLHAALVDWLRVIESQHNDGHKFQAPRWSPVAPSLTRSGRPDP